MQQRCVRKGNYSETYWGLIQSHRKSWRAGHCWAGEPAAAAAGAEVEALSGTVRWLEDQTCCYRSQMLTPQLLVEAERKSVKDKKRATVRMAASVTN